MRHLKTTGMLALGAVIGSIGLAGSANPASAADFYKDKTLTILLGHTPGGSYDLYAQLAARHMGQYIPGKPNIIVQHRPGGGGGKAGVYFFSKAPRDGTMIALLPETMAHTQLLDPKRGRWDMGKVKYIGSFAYANPAFGVRKETGLTSVNELTTKPLNIGCTGRTSQSSQMPAVIKNMTPAKFNMICGYRGSGPFMLALERGEVDAIFMNWATWKAKRADDLKAGKYRILMQAGLKRSPDLKDVPLVQETKLGDEKFKKVMTFMAGGAPIGRALFGAPGMPAEQVQILRTAFDKMVKDKAFLADAAKRKGLIAPVPGAELDKYNQEILKTPKDIVEAAARGFGGYKKACKNCGGKKKK